MSFTDWLLADIRLPKGMHSPPEPEHAWWRVMCLTGVDYRPMERMAAMAASVCFAGLVYTTAANISERPEGIKIATM